MWGALPNNRAEGLTDGTDQTGKPHYVPPESHFRPPRPSSGNLHSHLPASTYGTQRARSARPPARATPDDQLRARAALFCHIPSRTPTDADIHPRASLRLPRAAVCSLAALNRQVCANVAPTPDLPYKTLNNSHDPSWIVQRSVRARLAPSLCPSVLLLTLFPQANFAL